MIIAEMLEARPILFNESYTIFQQKGAAPKSKFGASPPINTNWLNDSQLDQLFSGYHYLQCMLTLLKRR
jgi:hypothetical protein